MDNGVELFLESRVLDISCDNGAFEVETTKGTIKTKYPGWLEIIPLRSLPAKDSNVVSKRPCAAWLGTPYSRCPLKWERVCL